MAAEFPDRDEFLCEWLTPDAGVVFRRGPKLEDFDTGYQHLDVYETPSLGRMFRLDGCNMTSERDEFFYHEPMVHIGLLALDAPRRALVIGGGDGGAAEEILKHPSIERIVIAELDEAVVTIARRHFAAVHRGALDDPRVEIRHGDGFDELRRTRDASDLIVMDLTDPVGPAEALYSAEFFREAARVLGDDGVLALHVGSPFFHRDRFRALIGELERVFAVVRPHFVHVPLYGANWGMACASQHTDPLRLSAADVDERLRARRIARLQYLNGDTFLAGFAQPGYVRELLRKRPRSGQV